MMPPLIAVIGPIEPALLTAWTTYYRTMGITDFLIAFHFPDHTGDQHRDRLTTAAADLGIGPTLISAGAWHEHTNSELIHRLRALAGPGWQMFADSDEFHQLPTPIGEALARADDRGHQVVGGLMLDRVTASGALIALEDAMDLPGLDQAFPLGGHLTHQILHGDPRKIVAARHDVELTPGQHRAPGHRPDSDHLVCVHHFKWRRGVLADLHQRITRFSSGEWIEHTPAVRSEAGRLLDHVNRHKGRLDPTDPRPGYRPVSLHQWPSGWAGEARRIVTGWRPPATTIKE